MKEENHDDEQTRLLDGPARVESKGVVPRLQADERRDWFRGHSGLVMQRRGRGYECPSHLSLISQPDVISQLILEAAGQTAWRCLVDADRFYRSASWMKLPTVRAVTLDRAAGRCQHLHHRARVAAGFELMSETHPQYSRSAIPCMS
jgi:hypothetical protein